MCVAYPVQLLQVDVLVAEAIEAYKIGELQPEVQYSLVIVTSFYSTTNADMLVMYRVPWWHN